MYVTELTLILLWYNSIPSQIDNSKYTIYNIDIKYTNAVSSTEEGSEVEVVVELLRKEGKKNKPQKNDDNFWGS